MGITTSKKQVQHIANEKLGVKKDSEYTNCLVKLVDLFIEIDQSQRKEKKNGTKS